MKVSELVEQLNRLPQELEIFTEGCDCVGKIGSVEIQTSEEWSGQSGQLPVIFIRRPDKPLQYDKR